MEPESGVPHRHDLAQCQVMLRHGSRTFHAASFLLPRPVRRSACALYAFCRLADDAVDLDADPGAALATLRERLSRVYDGTPWDHPADRALVQVVRRHSIPLEAPAALLEGFEWDAGCRRYEDLASLRAYGVRVAGTVGVMMTLLMGVRRPDALARACDLGVAMQLTNIARDVGEDARAGRLYLPLQWLRDERIDADAFLARPRWSPAIGRVVRRLLEEADRLYARSGAGIAQLPAACRPGINAARMLYREIGMEVHRRGLDPVSQRAVVSARRKARVLAQAVAAVGSVAMPLARSGVMSSARPGALPLARTGATSSARPGVMPSARPGATSSAPSGATSSAPSGATPRLARIPADAGTEPPLAEAAYLLQAVLDAPAPPEPAHWWDGSVLPGFEARLTWIVDLFERLEQRSRVERSGSLAIASRRAPG